MKTIKVGEIIEEEYSVIDDERIKFMGKTKSIWLTMDFYNKLLGLKNE